MSCPRMITSIAAINVATSPIWSTLQSKGIVQLSSRTGKLAQERLTLWPGRRRSSRGRSTSRTRERGLFPGLFRSCGEKSNSKRIAIQSRLALHRSITNRSRICWTYHQGYYTAVGTRAMDFSSRTWSWSTAVMWTTWFQCCWKAWRTERVDLMRWTKTLAGATRLWLST